MDKMVALLQRELILLRSQKAKRRNNAIAKALKKISLRSPTITVIRKATTSGIVSNQKTSCGLGNFYVGNY